MNNYIFQVHIIQVKVETAMFWINVLHLCIYECTTLRGVNEEPGS